MTFFFFLRHNPRAEQRNAPTPETNFSLHDTWATVLSGPTRHPDTCPGLRLLEKGALDRSSPHLIPQLFAPIVYFVLPVVAFRFLL